MGSFYPIQPEMVKNSCYYREITPNKSLRQDILFYYEFESTLFSGNIEIIPDACQDIIFYLGEDNHVILGNSPVSRGTYEFLPNGKYFGIRLNPKQTIMQYHMQLKHMVHQPFFDASQGCELNASFVKAVIWAKNFEQRVAICDEYFYLQKREMNLIDEVFSVCFDSIVESKGVFLLSAIQNKIGFSERYIRDIFYNKTGFSPKQLSKFIRIQLLLQHCLFEKTPLNIDHYGYYDPSHYYKEFKSLITLTPAEYMKMVIRP